ncbi:MAG: putative secreted protein [Cyanobacteria bacterium RYN_339]|nr:putative secreted protein [Cyanobacteria bacterium RYN_339]
MIRVMTLNLAGMEKEWFEGRAERLCAGLTPLAPDVLALQEAGVRGGVDFHHQVSLIGEWLDLDVQVFIPYGNPEEVNSNEQGGVALLTRWPLVSVEERRLPPGNYPPDSRTALLATIDHPEGRLHVVNTHLSWRPDEAHVRLNQLITILDRAQDEGWLHRPERFVLLGDLNATEDEPVIDLLERHLVDTFRAHHPTEPGYTWESENPYSGGYPSPKRRLDYIFVDRDATVSASGRALHTREWVASDHYAVWADLSWPEGDRP